MSFITFSISVFVCIFLVYNLIQIIQLMRRTRETSRILQAERERLLLELDQQRQNLRTYIGVDESIQRIEEERKRKELMNKYPPKEKIKKKEEEQDFIL